MIPSITAVRMSGAATRAELPLLVLGPDLGATASSLWTDVATQLGAVFDVLAWDLPGHGYNRGVPEEAFTVAELAAGVLRVVDDVLAERGELGGPFAYAGLGASATVGMQLFLDQPVRLRTLVALGAPVPLDAIPSTPGDLGSVSHAGYDLVFAALAEHDAGDRVDELMAYAEAGRIVVAVGDESQGPLHGEPGRVAWTLRHHVLGEAPPVDPEDMVTALEHLVVDTDDGDGEVDRVAVWERPGLDRRARHLVTIAALAGAGDHGALFSAVRLAVADGVTADEIFECLVQVGAYAGVHAVREAVDVAQEALDPDA